MTVGDAVDDFLFTFQIVEGCVNRSRFTHGVVETDRNDSGTLHEFSEVCSIEVLCINSKTFCFGIVQQTDRGINDFAEVVCGDAPARQVNYWSQYYLW